MNPLAAISLFAVLSSAPLAVAADGASAPRKPNIIVILSDDAGYNEFSSHGNPDFPTPRIDSIGAQGIRFTNGYVSGVVCSPSRAGLLTGRYQESFGHEFNLPPVYSETNGLPVDEALLPQVLKNDGYRTIALGKWHLGYAPKFHPLQRGFTDFLGFLQGARPYWPLPSPGRLNRLMLDDKPVAKEAFSYMTDYLGEKAVDYIAANKDRPFFLYLAFNATHTPLHATPGDLKKAGGNRLKAMAIALDRSVGTVLDAVDRLGLAKDTLIFFLNDNGGAIGHDNRPLRGHKGQTWEGGMRVPFMMRWTGVIPPGQACDTPVIALDIFATSLAAAGIPGSSGKPLDGVNLLPLATGKTKALPQRTLYWRNGASWALRDGDLKLVGGNAKQAPGHPALYDLAKDPAESKNLAATRPDDARRLEALYRKWAATLKPTPWRGDGGSAP